MTIYVAEKRKVIFHFAFLGIPVTQFWTQRHEPSQLEASGEVFASLIQMPLLPASICIQSEEGCDGKN